MKEKKRSRRQNSNESAGNELGAEGRTRLHQVQSVVVFIVHFRCFESKEHRFYVLTVCALQKRQSAQDRGTVKTRESVGLIHDKLMVTWA